MVTILTEEGQADIGATSDDGQLWLTEDDVAHATGWTLKPEGLCRGPVCVPVPAGREHEFVRDGKVDVAAFWRHMGKPAVHNAQGETWVLGEDAGARTAQLTSLQAPDFTLPDLAGRMHSLSHHRGKKVFLSTWASW